MTVRLEELLAASATAKDGPWHFNRANHRLVSDEPDRVGFIYSEEDGAIAALAPDAVRLLIDMGETLALFQYGNPEIEALLARLDRIGNTT